MKTCVSIVNFNTTLYTNAAIMTVIENSKLDDYQIIVFDNSSKYKYRPLSVFKDLCQLDVIDNTQGQVLDINAIQEHCFKLKSPNNYASAKHAASIQYLIDTCPCDNMILLDSDILLKKEIDFIDERIITAAHYYKYIKFNKMCARFEPYIQYFNIKMLRNAGIGIKYFDPYRMHGCLKEENDCYDTGASFLEDVVRMKFPFRKIEYKDYVLHCGAASWTTHINKNFIIEISKFVNDHQQYIGLISEF